MDSPQPQHPEWNPALEKIIKKEAEQSESLFWLHNRSWSLATKKNDILAIPAIIVGVVTGFITGGASETIPSYALGGLSIFVAVLNTLNNYYKFAQRAEGHRVASLYYLKLYKKLEIELALPQAQRTPAEALLKSIQEQMTRISETAPKLDSQAIQEFKLKFHKESVSKPVVANGLDQVHIYGTERTIEV